MNRAEAIRQALVRDVWLLAEPQLRKESVRMGETTQGIKRFGQVYERAFPAAQQLTWEEFTEKDMLFKDLTERSGHRGPFLIVLVEPMEGPDKGKECTAIVYDKNLCINLKRAKKENVLPLIGRVTPRAKFGYDII